MLRNRLSEALKEAMRSKDACAVSTLRLILAALKDRDIAVRSSGNSEVIGDDQVLEILQKMVRQRNDSIEMYAKAGRQDLVDKEMKEISVIARFLPKPLDEAEVEAAVESVIGELSAGSLKDMGRVMGALRQRYAGRMDFAKACTLVKEHLA